MRKVYIFLWLCTAIGSLEYSRLVDAEGVEYNKCSLTLKASNDGNLAAKLMCEGVEVLSDSTPIALGKSTPVPGTPITFFPDGEHLMLFNGDTDKETIFELDSLVIVSLPGDIQSLEYLLLVKNARLRIANSELDLDKLPQVLGSIHATTDAAGAVAANDAADPTADSSVVPTTGPVLILDEVSIVGGNLNNGALSLKDFPYLRITGGKFQHGAAAYTVYIMLDGMATLSLSNVEFLGGTLDAETTVLKGFGEATVVVEKCTFTNIRNTVLNWGEGSKAPSSFYFKSCTFTDNKGRGVALLNTPLSLIMEDSIVTGSSAKQVGGVFEINVLDPSDLLHVHLKRTTFRENQAPEGSVVYLKATGSDPQGEKSEVRLEDCTVEKNKLGTAIRVIGSNFVDTTIKGGKYIGNIDYSWGGALGLEKAGNVTIQDAVFEDNVVNGKPVQRKIPCGGAVHVEGLKSMMITGSTFKNNKVTSKEDGMGGGAVFVKSEDGTPTLTVQGTTFSGNYANNVGGSLLLENLDTVEMSETIFDSSSTNLGSGGAATLKDVKTLKATNLIVKGNSGRQKGGGVAIFTCSQVTIKGSKFSDNTLSDPKNGAADDEKPAGGSALSIESTTPCVLEIEETNFEGKSAYGSGGLLLVSDSSTCSLSGSNFKHNGGNVAGNGGVAKMDCSEGIAVNDCSFVGGGAANGGALAFEGSKVQVSDSVFEQCTAVADGGALYLSSSATVELTRTTFTSNKADKNGGAVSISGESEVLVKECDFTGNHADSAGGGGISVVKGTNLDITGGKYSKNSATHGGAIFADTVKTFKCTGVNLQGNGAGKTGGSIGATGSTDIQLQGLTFADCGATEDGACIHIIGGTPATSGAMNSAAAVNAESQLEISGSTFSDSKAKKNAGAFLAKDVLTVSVSDVVIDGTSGQNAGGGLVEGATILTVENLHIKDTKAESGDAGGLKVISTKQMTMTNSTFDKTKAGNNGGALVLESVDESTIEESIFADSSAGGFGGAIFFSGGEATITKSAFNRTSAKKGGALALDKDAQVVMTDTDIWRSEATSLEGGVLIALSCDSKASAIGQCTIDVPFKTGYDGMENKEEAEEMAAMAADPNCAAPDNIDIECEIEIWQIGGVDAFLIALYVFLAILAIFLFIMLGSIALTYDPPEEECPVRTISLNISMSMSMNLS